MTSSFAVDHLEVLFSAFADPTRIRILSLLAAGELCVCDIVDLLDLPQPTVSRHLAALRDADLVEATRTARFVYYRLAKPANPVHHNLIACVRNCFMGIESLDSERNRAVERIGERRGDPC
jgi:ArsR family transcriptional regulator